MPEDDQWPYPREVSGGIVGPVVHHRLEPGTAPGPVAGPRSRRLLVALVGAAVLVAGGIGAGLAVSLRGSGYGAGPSDQSGYAYYRSMIGRYPGSGMMGGSYGWMLGSSGYSWMMGGADAPGWMNGGSLPGFMTGSGTDPGTVIGRLFADAPGPRVSASQATALGNQTPAGASVDRAANRIVFAGGGIDLTVLAGPVDNPDETFRLAGLVNPTIVVPLAARVTLTVVNADPDTAHGLVVTAAGASSSWMPMMTSGPAFSGSAVWFLGNPTSAGMHEATVAFTASASGTYQYLCPVPGHAHKGMVGAFVVHPNPY